ncbi:CBS domain-containing protein [Erythrobacter sp. GH1-10]|uniref:CBS domain-containing protein n=1 Tax=Erythrobacter sp. GH1-10 TaxID=3349334 RepID=UPI0038779A8D
MTIARITANRSSTDVISCEVTTPVRDAVAMLAGKRIGALPVLDNGTVAGIFSERDVIYRLADEGSACLDKTVGEVMTSPAVTVEPSTKIDDALALMTKRRFRHFPVVENGALVDFVSIGDMVKLKMDEIEQEAQALRTYIST